MKLEQLRQLKAKMTLEEKIGQTVQLAGEFFDKKHSENTGPMHEMAMTPEKLKNTGSVLGVSGAATMIDIQKRHLAENRLGIPLLFMADVIHGYRTIFPVPLAMACTWDPKLIEKSSAIAALEAAVSGLHVTFSPMVDLVRDARWGRVMESTGEDVYLNRIFAKSFVRGYQGTNLAENTDKVAACIKHFAGYGAPVAGREYNTVELSERTLMEAYMPAYQAGIDEGSRLVMTAFNTIDGVPATGNKRLMKERLREEMGFEGVLISDWAAVGEMIPHGVAANLREAGKLAIEATVDIEMMTAGYSSYLKEMIENGEVSEAQLDEAVWRILQLKNDLGLFENPYRGADIEREKVLVFSKEHRQKAQEIAEQSIVLLKNESVLPLSPDQKVALAGPKVHSKDVLGSWSWKGKTEESVSLYNGLREHLPPENMLTRPESDLPEETDYADEDLQEAEVIIVALGESSDMSGEGASKSTIKLPDDQIRLVRELKKWNKPLIVTLFNGRPLDLTDIVSDADAIVEAWFPGTEAGTALGNVLFGTVNPSGKLTMSFPRNVGQTPIYYNQDNTGRPLTEYNQEDKYLSRYMDVENTPLFPFGFGLSYTKFAYGKMILSADRFKMNEELKISIPVKNVGDLPGKEVVQLYIRDRVGEVVRPVKELKRFKKIALDVHEEKVVHFELTEKDLHYIHQDLTSSADSGEFDIMVGPDSQTVQVETVFLD